MQPTVCPDWRSLCTQLEHMRNFDLDAWRKRYIDWVQLNKARLSDMFRRADRDADGRITREEFIESVLSSSAHY